MKIRFSFILVLLCISLSVSAQKGFFSKSEAENNLNDTVKGGKWLEYLDVNEKVTKDTNAPYYRLTEYKHGKPVGIVRAYYRDGHLKHQMEYSDGKANGDAKAYYEDGTLQQQYKCNDGKN